MKMMWLVAIATLHLSAPSVAEAAAPAGDGAAHHEPAPTDDDDGDGTPNWRDSDAEGYKLKKLGYHAFNLALLLTVLGVLLRRPLSDVLRSRAVSIKKDLVDSAKSRDEAQKRFEELSARLAAFESEVAKMKADAEADVANEEKKLIARAHEEAKRIAETSQKSVRDEITRARLALRQEAVELAVKLAEQTLRSSVKADDQKKLAQQFLDSMRGADHG